MKNKYLSQLQMLQSVSSQGQPFVSMFVPLTNSFAGPAEDFRRLLAQANSFLKTESREKVVLEMPDWALWSRQGTRTLAIYHRKGFSSVIPLGIEMSARVVVADTFHVKPLIASSLSHIEGLHLHFHTHGCTLFRVTPTQCHTIETFLPNAELPSSHWPAVLSLEDLREFLEYVRDEVRVARTQSVEWLTLSGTQEEVLGHVDFWRRTNLKVQLLGDSFQRLVPEQAIGELQKMILRQTDQNFRHIVERLRKLAQGEPVTDLRTVGAKIVGRQVTQLCVSLEDIHFGEVLPDGEVRLHPGQQGVRDDDVLDDLVELALRNGVSVRVVPRKYLPSGQVLIAA